MILSAATIFVSAFLLFLVQPIIAKQILPWFGGSAAVWTTCLVFFQTALLAGYGYADFVVRKLLPRTQIKVHAGLLVASLITLPIIPGAFWKPIGGEDPLWLILGLLAATIGLPYLLLSTTSPLVQAWFARQFPGRSPYRLFALSNFASMLALLGYPFLLEPWVTTRMQAWGWTAGYGIFVLLCIATAIASVRARASSNPASSTAEFSIPAVSAMADSAAAAPAPARRSADPPPTHLRQALWCALAATGSVLLLAVSNHVVQNIAAVPLLWIAPLSIYLLTFILCFDGTGWYRRDVFLGAAAAALGAMAWTLADPDLTHEIWLQLGVFGAGLFFACMFCHGELASLKPAPIHLTRFYLMISLGGALGSVLVGVVAPLVLPAYFELALGLCACALLLVWQVRRAPWVFGILGVVAAITAITCAIWGIRNFYESTIVTARNFYGVLRVQQFGSEGNEHRSLIHGTILHGNQYLAPDLRRRPTTYYTATSGVGRVFESLHPRMQPLKVGIIGLGTGTLAAWGTPGDEFRFYDINPAVVTIARRDFTYLADSEAHIEIPLGDARLTLEREPPQMFDLLVIDAFSSDAIPVHLITVEALDVYLRHMNKTGVIAFHVTNRFLNLIPVVDEIAKARGLADVLITDEGEDTLASRSDWVLLARDPALFAKPQIAEHVADIEARPDWRLWTDDFNNLFQVLKIRSD